MPSHTLEPIPCLNGVPGPVDPISHSASIVFSAGRVSGPVDSLSHSASVVFSAGHIPESEHQSRCTMPLGHSLHQFSNPHYHHYNTEVYRISPSISTQEPIITLSQWCSKPSRSHQPFGFGSVFGRPCPRIRNTKAVTLPMPLGHSGVQFSNPALQFSRQFPHNSLYPVSNSQWCFRPSRSPQPFGFGSVFGRPCPRIRNTKAVVLCLFDTPCTNQFSNPHYNHYDAVVYRIFPSISTQEPSVFGPFEVPESDYRSRCTMPLGHSHCGYMLLAI